MGRTTTTILTWETASLTSPVLTRTWAPVSVAGSSPPSPSPSSSSLSPSPCLSASRWSRSTREPSSSDWADFSMEARRDLVSLVCLFVISWLCLFGQLVGSCQLLLQSFIFISKTLPPPLLHSNFYPPRQYLGLKVRFIGGWDWRDCPVNIFYLSKQTNNTIQQTPEIEDMLT